MTLNEAIGLKYKWGNQSQSIKTLRRQSEQDKRSERFQKDEKYSL